MKTWKTITIIAVALIVVGASVATAYACWWGPGTTAPYSPYAGTANQYAIPNGPTTVTTAPSTQNLPPVSQTNTQVPTLYTPPTTIIAPGYAPYGSMGGMMGGMMMGRWGYGATYPSTTTSQLTINQAAQIATTYVTSLNSPDLKVTQVEEYTANFYVQVNEQSTGYGAFQLLINKVTGVVTPEMGPNMMWNTKYTFGAGYCNWFKGTTTATPTITLDQAKANAQQYLSTYLPGTTVGDVTTFYGYYNVEVLNAGATYGMLSVNAYTGQVWYHTWHGAFIQELQVS
jgi:hypothetical protein